ncbi:hypothetical protein J5N97_006878 [Dioscorea zingiberensis]|uniref:FLZ-type domain-containing protein n=1 Tax=Dioscorea zingiberensis TaxID=325984 RepID=A0A9D5DE73_9LILI|nr:hypothetical protein J5N97_006878 [Dioscorea zingiberensis]
MLRRNKSIFHLGEDDDEEDDDQKHKKERKEYQRKSFVGLQILIQHHSQTISNIVTKHTLKAPQVHKSPSLFGFLTSCHLCKRELSRQKDVYMYRGDQGYCTPECRNRQMILDERRELEVSSINERVISTVPHHHELGLKIKDSDHQNKISAAA